MRVINLLILAGLGLHCGDCALAVGCLKRSGCDGKISARLRFQMTIIHLHVHSLHELNLMSQFLDLFLQKQLKRNYKRHLSSRITSLTYLEFLVLLIQIG